MQTWKDRQQRERVWRSVTRTITLAGLIACSDTSGASNPGASNPGAGNGEGASGGLTMSRLSANCPQVGSFARRDDWTKCLANYTFKGKEPFSGTPCAIEVLADGALRFSMGGQEISRTPPTAEWSRSDPALQESAPVGTVRRNHRVGGLYSFTSLNGGESARFSSSVSLNIDLEEVTVAYVPPSPGPGQSQRTRFIYESQSYDFSFLKESLYANDRALNEDTIKVTYAKSVDGAEVVPSKEYVCALEPID
jgi:hypothetical protein